MLYQRSEVLKWLGIFAIIGVMLFFYFLQQNNSDSYIPEFITEESVQESFTTDTEVEDIERIGVHAAGAVKNPGVYFLPTGARVVDLIKAAGGITPKADLNSLNLAAPLVDGEKVLIPELELKVGVSGFNSGNIYENKNKKVSINNATREELMTLPGIGAQKAEAIINYRTEKGKFSKIEDLKEVHGIGEKTYLKLAEKITL